MSVFLTSNIFDAWQGGVKKWTKIFIAILKLEAKWFIKAKKTKHAYSKNDKNINKYIYTFLFTNITISLPIYSFHKCKITYWQYSYQNNAK